ncbi:gp16 family protein [Photorhabdus bodei]|uniref:Regulatory protein GemA n=1 Tax=Photorhabdus bodei TaxID=2029681 RepID=A0AAW6BSF1_9GAMM|nr:regulatory protein GemA [Photorhabdus bodei]MDB6374902.1 regulatory protein GemA [Photorhabdus bodei]
MNKQQLIRLIHIAKTKLKLDDDTYRAALASTTGKMSCCDMSHAELKQVYAAFVERGFKRRFKPHHQRVKSDSTGRVRTAEISKIRAIWITMHQQGFVHDGSESALNKFVMRQTAKINGEGVAEVGWLTPTLIYPVIESLKKWHLRLMTESMVARQQPLPASRGYDAICHAFNMGKSS